MRVHMKSFSGSTYHLRRAVFPSCYRQARIQLELNGGKAWSMRWSVRPPSLPRRGVTLLKALSVVSWDADADADADAETDLLSACVLKPVRTTSHLTIAVHSIDVEATTA
jgi:hypothetical protein